MGSGFGTWDQVNSEYREYLTRFPSPLPGGKVFPPDLPSESPDESGASYQMGYGEALAYVYWGCAWQDVVIRNQKADPKAAASALSQYVEGLSDPVYLEHFPDPDKAFQRDVVDRAKLGDFSRLREVFESDCDWYRSWQR
ncbi:MAG: hypothetical protein KJ817_06880 [Actinobacteria bacterium]|nr:hypothetical protein [Actinomycetota bacterium]MBU4207157.1 hypothetical protein [Actinomycetota bacterium]